MSKENAAAGEQSTGATNQSREQATQPGFLSRPAVRRTLVRHIASYLLVAVAIMLLVRLTPDIGTLLGIEGLIEPVNDKLPAAADAVGGAAAVVLAIFAFLLTLLVGPVVAAVVGAVVAIRETADRKTLTLASGLGGFAGYLVPMVALFLLVDSRIPMAAITLSDAITNGVAMSVPSALAAAGMTYLTRWR